MKSIVHAIQLQGHSDSVESSESAENYHDSHPTLITAVPKPPSYTTTPSTQQTPTETIMQISAEALHGIPRDTTLSVLVHIGGTQAVGPIDTGSTSTFLDSKFVSKNQLNSPYNCSSQGFGGRRR
jgi:hypothetical protein